jgi:hypothetical protein
MNNYPDLATFCASFKLRFEIKQCHFDIMAKLGKININHFGRKMVEE